MMNYRQMFYCAALAMLTACGTADRKNVGTLIGALDDNAWKSSEWISVVNVPVVTGTVNDGARAADGASWFVSMVTNEGKVERAEWMTSGLGVYDLYVNGKLVGKEVLKPGFTHPFKTKRSFTYDVTDVKMPSTSSPRRLRPAGGATRLSLPAAVRECSAPSVRSAECCASRIRTEQCAFTEQTPTTGKPV